MLAALARRVRAHAGRAMARALGVRTAAAVSLEELTVASFLEDRVGAEHGLGRRERRRLLRRFAHNAAAIPTATVWPYHAVIAAEILRTPRAVRGDVVECGCYAGGSTANLSLACAAAGRRLKVFDSFEGLPEEAPGTVHQYPYLGVWGQYRGGMYAARLEDVRANVARYGDVSVCDFLPGWFADTLPGLASPVVVAFADVDLASSLRDCIRYLWPLLVDGGTFFTDDSCDMTVVRAWFDDPWWRATLGQDAPGYVGSGCGLPLAPEPVSLGFARKVGDPSRAYGRVSWLHYPDAEAT